ncbi:MAG: hypothetical protein OXC37_05735 [Bdellovibrionaceae bacterium]|nr:hypothetical protein [Pseudobdellovibrionaceae bacterium]
MKRVDKFLSKKRSSFSALIMCKPDLRGFFQSKSLESIIVSLLKFILNKKEVFCLGKLKSQWGESYLIVLPHSTVQMREKNLTERHEIVLSALKLAQSLNAEKISFAGLLPSLLNHFKDLPDSYLAYKNKITKGHIITCIGITLLFEKIIQKTSCKTLAFVGLGSIGRLSLSLLLEKVVSPQKLIFCDLRKRQKELETLAEKINSQYKIPIQICYYAEKNFLEIYSADFILGAVSSKFILDSNLLQKGAILIDDSFPPILSVSKSIKRMKEKQDVLILSGGKLASDELKFSAYPYLLPNFFSSFFIKQMGRGNLPGCWLEALISAQNLFTNQTYEDENLLKIWQNKEKANLKASSLHFSNYKISSLLEKKVYQLREKWN